MVIVGIPFFSYLAAFSFSDWLKRRRHCKPAKIDGAPNWQRALAPATIIVVDDKSFGDVELDDLSPFFETRCFDLSWAIRRARRQSAFRLLIGLPLMAVLVWFFFYTGVVWRSSFIFWVWGASATTRVLFAVFKPIQLRMRPGHVEIVQGTLTGTAYRLIDQFELARAVVQVNLLAKLVTIYESDEHEVSFSLRLVPDWRNLVTYLAAAGIRSSSPTELAQTSPAGAG